MKLHEFIELSKASLSEIYDKDEAAAIVRVWISDRLNVALSALTTLSHTEIIGHQLELLQADLLKLLKGIPMQQVLGIAWFCDLPFMVTRDVLIPRPETEELVCLLMEEMQNEDVKVLDICSGSGCIAIALKNKFPLSSVTGCDISFEALMVAAENGKKNNTDVDYETNDCK